MYQHSLVISNLYSTYMGYCHEYHTEDVFSEFINFDAINLLESEHSELIHFK